MENMILVASLVMSFVFTMYFFGFFSYVKKESKKLNNDKVFKYDFIAFFYIVLKIGIDVLYFLFLSYIIFKFINIFALYIYYNLVISASFASSIEPLLFISLFMPVVCLALLLSFLKK